MKRIIDYYLLQWKHTAYDRQPLLLRGARQVGKTYAVRQLGKSYESFVEINLESQLEVHVAFQSNLDPHQIIIKLMAATGKKIIPGETLLFIDEIQVLPQAITALRYFYELLPELHVIAAGSLLDFAIAKVGVPVGRLVALYMRPVSFIEYLVALKQEIAAQLILDHDPQNVMGQPGHKKYLEFVGQYLALGGMPKAIDRWINRQNPLEVKKVHASILDFYRQDFNTYAQSHEVSHVEKIFEQIPQQMAHKFKYSIIDGNYKKKDLEPALKLLVTAGIALKVYYSAGQGLPLAAQRNDLDYKVIFLDIGLAQTNLGNDLAQWFLHPQQEFINKGDVVEAFVGQELAAYASPHNKQDLFYWHKDSQPQAEIDYLIALHYQVIPVESKAGSGSTLHSLHYFIETHSKNSPYGVRFSSQDYSIYDKIHSYPLYAIAAVISKHDPEMAAAMQSLFER